ncbi:hypothetical protein AS888_18840 [Peribacillus simplex]|uniref:Uncharacterized protein n=1 Tax=Peribacillus simplex TaxID=1478 RepID=A0A109MYY5_9BACI|nr:hypothetical protein AS888_18840 [Peribacillus simplex]
MRVESTIYTKIGLKSDAKPKLANKSTKLTSKVGKLASKSAEFASKVAKFANNARISREPPPPIACGKRNLYENRPTYP